jgi:hypothetical protein
MTHVEIEKLKEIDLNQEPFDEDYAHDFVKVECDECTGPSIANEEMLKLMLKFDKRFKKDTLSRLDSFIFRLKSKFKKRPKLEMNGSKDETKFDSDLNLSLNFRSLKHVEPNAKYELYKQSKSLEFKRLTSSAYMSDIDKEFHYKDLISDIEQENMIKELFSDKCTLYYLDVKWLIGFEIMNKKYSNFSKID